MGWINNSWVVGIGGGVLSGVFVAWITHLFLQRGVNKEHREKVASANRDVIYAIRPGIPEGQIPTPGVIDALIHATARRHGIAGTDMYGAREIAEELIKEVMDTSFLSSAKKSEYCEQLTPLQEPVQVADVGTVVTTKPFFLSNELAEYREKTTQWVSAMLGVITTTMAIFSTFYLVGERKKPLLENEQGLFIVIMAMTILLSMMAVYLVSVRLRKSKMERATRRALRVVEKVPLRVEIDDKPL
jgi:hypothetical protein